MINSQNLRTITDMRKNADGLLKFAEKTKAPVGILKNNELKAYLIDAKTLETLEGLVEDHEDAKLVENRAFEEVEDFNESWTKNGLPKK